MILKAGLILKRYPQNLILTPLAIVDCHCLFIFQHCEL